MQWIRLAWSLAMFKAGIRIAISTAMMAITTNSSINVKPAFFIGINHLSRCSKRFRCGNKKIKSIILHQTEYVKDGKFL